MSFSKKHARELSSSASGNDNGIVRSIERGDEQKPPRKRPARPNNERRGEKMTEQATQTTAMKGIEGLALEKGDSEDGTFIPHKMLQLPKILTISSDDEEPNLRRNRGDFTHRASSSTTDSPKRPTVSPIIDLTTPTTTPNAPIPVTQPATPIDPLTTKLDKIQILIDSDNLTAAFKALTAITRANAWQATATRDAAIRIYNYTKLLGDGKKQGMDQARIINDERRENMELKAEVKNLASENARLRMEAMR